MLKNISNIYVRTFRYLMHLSIIHKYLNIEVHVPLIPFDCSFSFLFLLLSGRVLFRAVGSVPFTFFSGEDRESNILRCSFTWNPLATAEFSLFCS